MNSQCPACRTPYDDANYAFKPEPERKNKQKRDPAQKEAEMAAAAQKVAAQQAKLRSDMIARAQAAQSARGGTAAGGKMSQAQRQQQEMVRGSASAGGSWAAMAGTNNGGPPAPSSQAWPTLGGSSAPAQGDNGDVDDWESLATGEVASVPSLDDAKNNAEVAALMRQVADLQKKVQEAQNNLAKERSTREACTEKCIALRTQQVNFDSELMALASKFQVESQAEGAQDPGDQSTAAALAAVAPGANSSWRSGTTTTQGLPPPGNPSLNNDLWGGGGGGGSRFAPAAGNHSGGFGAFGDPVATASGQQQGLPGLSGLFGGRGIGSGPVMGNNEPAMGGSMDNSPWSSTPVNQAGSSPWDMSGGGSSAGSALGGGIW